MHCRLHWTWIDTLTGSIPDPNNTASRLADTASRIDSRPGVVGARAAAVLTQRRAALTLGSAFAQCGCVRLVDCCSGRLCGGGGGGWHKASLGGFGTRPRYLIGGGGGVPPFGVTVSPASSFVPTRHCLPTTVLTTGNPVCHVKPPLLPLPLKRIPGPGRAYPGFPISLPNCSASQSANTSKGPPAA